VTSLVLEVEVEGNGVRAVLATSPGTAPPGLGAFLADMAAMTNGLPLSGFSWEWAFLPQTMQPSDEKEEEEEVGANAAATKARESPRQLQEAAGLRGEKKEKKEKAGAVLEREVVRIPQTKFHFRCSGNELEGGCDLAESGLDGVCCDPSEYFSDPPEQCGVLGSDVNGVDVQFPWETKPQRTHAKALKLGPFDCDRFPATKGDYAAYLNDTGYAGGGDDHNWLKDWATSSGGAPVLVPADAKQPVTYVSLKEAAAFCTWDGGKRLPQSFEWQLAAQGGDFSSQDDDVGGGKNDRDKSSGDASSSAASASSLRLYPWGDELVPGNFPTPVHDSRTLTGASDVDAHSPAGDSAWGVSDLVGNVWQYTASAFSDAHTKAVLLRGSSYWQPYTGAQYPTYPQYLNWYFPAALELNKHGKYFLMNDAYERAGTVGFRCVKDAEGGQGAPYHYADVVE